MNFRFPTTMFLSAVAIFASGGSWAADTPAAPQKAAASKPSAATEKVKPKKKVLAPSVELVDINSATADELRKLPSLDDADVAKIVAGRPYGSKSWLSTHHVIAPEKYEGISSLIAAKDAAKHLKSKK